MLACVISMPSENWARTLLILLPILLRSLICPLSTFTPIIPDFVYISPDPKSILLILSCRPKEPN